MYRLKIRTKFEAAHRLISAYSDQCQNIHGHSYKVDWFFKGPTLNDAGVLIDFKKLKARASSVTNCWDHACILQDTDALALSTELASFNVIQVPFAPTAENMAKYFFKAVRIVDPLEKVRVWETEDCYAEYSAE